MSTNLLLLLLSFLAPPSAAPVAVPVVPGPLVLQDEGETPTPPDERPEVKALIEKLEGHVKQRGEEDEMAIAAVDELFREFAASGPKDRAAIVDALAGCFDAKRTKELEPDVPDDRLYMACAVALRDMGPESVEPLIDLVGHKAHKKNLRLQRQVVLSLGKTKAPEAVKTLLGLLDHPEPEMQAAGAEALGEFGEAEEKRRKEIFEEILKVMMGQKGKVDTAPDDIEAAERWNTISGPMIASLQRLTGHDERVPEEWQRWWNKNKKEDWDAPAD